MPKDQFDFEDPFELNGMAFLTQEDTSEAMAECFVEEFQRMGYGHKQILALFRNRQYLGPNLVYQQRGEPFVCDLIAEAFARRGKLVTWGSPDHELAPPVVTPAATPETAAPASAAANGGQAHTDPMGGEIPAFNL